MVNYTCNICLKTFKQKGHFVDHVKKRKKPCQPKTNIISQNPHNTTQPPQETTQNLTNTEIENSTTQLKKNNECEYCNTKFSRSDALKRHMDKFCKVKKDMEQKQIDNQAILQQFEELKKEIEELKKKPQSINNNVVINNSNNNNSKTLNLDNKSINIDNKSVNIVAHGKEDLSTIDLETKLNFLNTLDFPSIIPNMAKHIFINDDKPEFKNFRVTDMSRNKSEYHDGNQWMAGRADQGVLKIFENINDVLIEPFTDENLEKTIKFIQKDPKKYSKQTINFSKTYCRKLYDTKDKENISNKNDILDELRLIFYNNREKILKVEIEKDNVVTNKLLELKN
jgi:hypothetical protein